MDPRKSRGLGESVKPYKGSQVSHSEQAWGGDTMLRIENKNVHAKIPIALGISCNSSRSASVSPTKWTARPGQSFHDANAVNVPPRAVLEGSLGASSPLLELRGVY